MIRFDGLVDVERSNGVIEKLPMATVELACSIQPDANSEIQFAEVRTWVKQLRDMYGYPIKAVTYDGIFSTESIQQWRKQGMKTGHVSVDRTSVPYKQLRDTFNDGRLRMFTQDVLLAEFMELEYDELKDKVDHPVNGSKDVADAVCGVGDHEGEVAGAQRAERLADEVGVAGRVDDVELPVEPLGGEQRGLDGDLVGLFAGMIIAGGGAVGDGAHAADTAAGGEHGFAEHGLAAGGVADHGEVADVLG